MLGSHIVKHCFLKTWQVSKTLHPWLTPASPGQQALQGVFHWCTAPPASYFLTCCLHPFESGHTLASSSGVLTSTSPPSATLFPELRGAPSLLPNPLHPCSEAGSTLLLHPQALLSGNKGLSFLLLKTFTPPSVYHSLKLMLHLRLLRPLMLSKSAYF